MLNLNKNKRNSTLKGIAMILALVTVFALCLVGCTDQEARDAAAEAQKAADAAVTQAQLNTAINAALADLDTLTVDDVKAEIATAVGALELGVSQADVDAAIKAAVDAIEIPEIPTVLTEAQIKAIVDESVKALAHQITDLNKLVNDKANAKIDIDVWNNTTEKVIELCAKLDADYAKFVSESAGEYAEKRQVGWTDDEESEPIYAYDAQAIETIYETAKIRLYRAVTVADVENLDAQIAADIAKVPTCSSVAAEVVGLIGELSFPVTLSQGEAVVTAVQHYGWWADAYFNGDEEAAAEVAATKGIDLAMLEYSSTKLIVLVLSFAEVIGEVNGYIVEDLKFEGELKADEATFNAVVADEVLKQVSTDDKDLLVEINKVYNTVVGTECKLSDEALKTLFTDHTAESLILADEYMNNGETTLDGEPIVYFFPAIDVYLNHCYEREFDALKADLVTYVLTTMEDYASQFAAGSAEKKMITDIGTAFANKINSYMQWKVEGGDHYLVDDATDKNILGKDYYLYLTNKEGADNHEIRIEKVIEHIAGITAAEKENVGFDGFNAVIADFVVLLANGTDAQIKAAYDAAVNEANIKAIIDAAYDNLEPALIGGEDEFVDLRIETINAIVAYVDSLNLDVETATAEEKVQIEAVKDITVAYVNYIFAMEFEDWKEYYVSENIPAAVEKVEEHFYNIYGAAVDAIDGVFEAEDVVKYAADNSAATAVNTVVTNAAKNLGAADVEPAPAA